MKNDKKPSSPVPSDAGSCNGIIHKNPLGWAAVLLAVLLAVVFWRCFIPSYVLFSNDGPYGGMVAELNRLPTTLLGVWADSNWFGNESLSPALSVSTLLRLITTPLGYAKLLCPVSLFIAGIGACFCFRKLRLAPMACILGAVAAVLNSDFLSTSAWGVATQVIGFGFMFIAVGLISDNSIGRQWVRIILAGFAVGVGVMEAYDIGALFSLFVAAYVVYHALFLSEAQKSLALRAGKGVLRIALVAGFAGFLAVHTLAGLVGTQIKGIAGMAQDEQTRAIRWAETTSFSVPKVSTLTVFVPGIFGFRDNWYMYEYDSPKEDQYWSSNPAHPIGTGFYAGVPVIVIGLWAAFQSFRRKDSPFTHLQRRAIWFWGATAITSLLFAWGSFAPFYQLFYALPYASTIRNPQKFMHVLNWSLIILFAYGVHGLAVGYCQNAVAHAGGVMAQFKAWLAKASGFERKWVYGSFIAIGIAVLGWFIYAAQSNKLIAFLETSVVLTDRVGVPPPGTDGATTDSHAVAAFSIHAVAWFALLLALTVGIMSLIFSGQFSGSRAKMGAAVLGALLIFDLGRVATYWIVYWDLDYKYIADPVVQFLAEKPYEHRVSSLLGYGIPVNTPQLGMLANMYGDDWKQHLFLEKNVQCAEVVQEPRVALDKMAFMTALAFTNNLNVFRFWELSNTGYLLGPRGNLGPQFRILKTFNFVPKRSNPGPWPADYRAEIDPNGELAVYEFLGALPRAKLYSNWQVNTNDQSTLQTLASQSFNPHQSVLVAQNIPASTATNATTDPGTVEIDPNYKSKRIELHADVKVPAVLLLSERYNDKWHVEVDGKPAELLRCNYIERGVYLTPGKHDIAMHFRAPIDTLCISAAAIVIALALWSILIFLPKAEEAAPESVPAATTLEKSGAK